ncbi:hypothetical protein HK405_004703 [Cladochytrium tenue]|nr:hypothetical protein HK405_004703 [Cladochytrium tenue]
MTYIWNRRLRAAAATVTAVAIVGSVAVFTILVLALHGDGGGDSPGAVALAVGEKDVPDASTAGSNATAAHLFRRAKDKPYSYFEQTMIQVRDGDCFILTFANLLCESLPPAAANPALKVLVCNDQPYKCEINTLDRILIDGGAIVIQAKAAFPVTPALAGDNNVMFNHVVITHTDTDHINGIIGMLENQGTTYDGVLTFNQGTTFYFPKSPALKLHNLLAGRRLVTDLPNAPLRFARADNNVVFSIKFIGPRAPYSVEIANRICSPTGTSKDRNEISIVFEATLQSRNAAGAMQTIYSGLFTGDSTEKALMKFSFSGASTTIQPALNYVAETLVSTPGMATGRKRHIFYVTNPAGPFTQVELENKVLQFAQNPPPTPLNLEYELWHLGSDDAGATWIKSAQDFSGTWTAPRSFRTRQFQGILTSP